MCKKEQPVIKQDALNRELVLLYDEFTDFHDRCSFLCDAFACIVANHEYVDENTINGFDHYSNWLKQQLAVFKAKLKHIHEHIRNESDLV